MTFITTNTLFAEARADIKATDADYAVKQKYVLDSLQISLDTIETYLDRKLEYGPETETIDPFMGKTNWQLKRYPIDTIDTVSVGAVSDYYVNKRLGVVAGTIIADKAGFVITYKGGFKTLPSEIEHVLWQIFDVAYADKVNNAVINVDDEFSNMSIKSVSVPDVGVIAYQADPVMQGSHSVPTQHYGYITPLMAQYLSRYRAASICGVG